MEAHLVADTNLFFECKALEELQWGELGYDPVVILLTKPVLDEIDKHKKANGRTRKRALEIFKRVRGMLTTSTTELVIREASPRVVLRRMANVVPDETLSGALDYGKNDDRLIGILAALSQKASGHKVMLFTDDTGPAATADGLGLPFAMINVEWRRPAEESTEDKKIRELEKNLATYRSQEPKISIDRCIPADDAGVVTVTRRIAQPLTESEIEEMLDALRLKHPMKTDFSPPADTSSGEAEGKFVAIVRFEPPSTKAIQNYQEVLYPQWLNNCRTVLSKLHIGRDEIEKPVILQWAMTNDGTRPASQVRVQFEAQGPLAIRRLQDRDDEVDEDDASDGQSVSAGRPIPTLPQSPKPPAFKKVVTRVPAASNLTTMRSPDIPMLRATGFLNDEMRRISTTPKTVGLASFDPMFDALKNLDSLNGFSRLLEHHRNIFETPDQNALLGTSAIGQFSHLPIEPIRLPQPFIPPKHDPEAFYYDWPAKNPVKKGALTCDLWRHKNSEEVFEFEVLFTKEGEARGSILCTVHAENLTKPETSRISINRKVELFRLLDLARIMVQNCE